MILAALVLAAVAQDAPVPAVDTRGMHRELARTFDEAREEVRRDPGSSAAWRELGALFDAHELFVQAERCYRESHRLAPDEFAPLYLLALAADRCGRPVEETLPLFRAAAAMRPDYAPVHLNLGDVLARQGRLDEALSALEGALEVDPWLFAARRSRGQVLLCLNRPERALADLEVVADAAPDDRATSVSLARALVLTGDLERAREVAERARTQKPALEYEDPVRAEVLALSASTAAIIRRAQRLREAGRTEEAAAELQTLLRLRPRHANAHALLGDLCRETGDVEGAIEWLGRAAALDPKNVDLRVALAELLLRGDVRERWAKAAAHLRSALDLAPDDAGARELLGVALASLGRFEPALGCFERAVREGGTLGERSYVLRGTALFELGRLDEVLASFEEAVRVHPESGHLHYDLGVALELAGRPVEAMAVLEHALALGTDMPASERLAALRAR